jgi:NAD(P)-dependent dehydrogenase (short-subunit alcohol dehydrogenase family)
MAQRFAREGMKVVLADVEEKPLAEAREAIARAGADALAVRTDVSKEEQIQDLARRCFDAFGGAHILCNNAGIGVGGLMWEVPRADWDWIVGVNLMSIVYGVRAFVPRMIEQGEGHVVNTASIAGLIAAPGMSAYCATKHAVVGMSECLHHELVLAAGGKVKVSVLCPAWVKTRISDSERNRPESAKRPPRPLTPQEQMVESMMRAAIASGIPPEVVAEKVLQAVLEEKFWILTHPKTKRLVEKRTQGILTDAVPQFDPGVEV